MIFIIIFFLKIISYNTLYHMNAVLRVHYTAPQGQDASILDLIEMMALSYHQLVEENHLKRKRKLSMT